MAEETFVMENVVIAITMAPDEDNIVEFEPGIFIEEIRQLPCLWNTSLAVYKGRNVKANAWNRLSLKNCVIY